MTINLQKFEYTTSLNKKKLPTLKTYELRSILQRLKTNTMIEESEQTLTDVLNSLSEVNGLLKNAFDRLSKVKNHLNNVERRLTNLPTLENKIKDLEDSQDFFSKNQYSKAKNRGNWTKKQQLTKENSCLAECLKVFENKLDHGRQEGIALEQDGRGEMVKVSRINVFEEETTHL